MPSAILCTYGYQRIMSSAYLLNSLNFLAIYMSCHSFVGRAFNISLVVFISLAFYEFFFEILYDLPRDGWHSLFHFTTVGTNIRIGRWSTECWIDL